MTSHEKSALPLLWRAEGHCWPVEESVTVRLQLYLGVPNIPELKRRHYVVDATETTG